MIGWIVEEALGGIRLVGVCGKVGGNRGAVGVWGPIRNRGVAGGGVVEWGMVLRWGVDPFERREEIGVRR